MRTNLFFYVYFGNILSCTSFRMAVLTEVACWLEQLSSVPKYWWHDYRNLCAWWVWVYNLDNPKSSGSTSKIFLRIFCPLQDGISIVILVENLVLFQCCNWDFLMHQREQNKYIFISQAKSYLPHRKINSELPNLSISSEIFPSFVNTVLLASWCSS